MQRIKLLCILTAVFYCVLGHFNGVVSAKADEIPSGELKIVYAINAGGDTHEDVHGIVYLKDPSNQGIASDFGLRLNIERAHPNDQVLYQTERYSSSSFGYDIPIKEDGSYVLVLKFSEVYFRHPNAKVFNVILNNQHKILENLDIYGNVGYATAHDEIIPFYVTDHGKKLIVGTSSSPIRSSRIRLDFVKGSADNPKVNAFFVAKGSIEDIPQLPPPNAYDDNDYAPADDAEEEEFYGDDDEIQFSRSDLGYEGAKLPVYKGASGLGRRINVRSGPMAEDPWDSESPFVVYMPVLASIAASIISFFFLRVVSKP